MSVSPDLEAFCCYGLVFLIGLAAATGQVSKRLGSFSGQWIMVNTWLLFFAYALVPVALFWLLDRTNAIHDTSLFAAVLVGFGYQQILSGSVGTIRAPGDISSLWKPFDAWANGIGVRIRERIALNDGEFDERLLSEIRTDATKFQSLLQVAMVHTGDVPALQKSLSDIAATQDALSAKGVLAKQAALLYENLRASSTQQFKYLLYKNGVISRKWYWWYAKEWRSKATAIGVAAVLLIGAVAGVAEAQTPNNFARYYLWRLRKTNATDFDRFRARRRLSGYLATTPDTYPRLTVVLSDPNLSPKAADDVLELLLENRAAAAKQNIDLQRTLIGALRTENSDVRSRIQKELVYLADENHSKIPQDLRDWKPDSKDSSIAIEEYLKKWSQAAQEPAAVQGTQAPGKSAPPTATGH